MSDNKIHQKEKDYLPTVAFCVIFGSILLAVLFYGFGHEGWTFGAVTQSSKQSTAEIRKRQREAEIATAILTKTIAVGMSPSDVVASIGQPRTKNLTKTSNIEFEQWVYYSTYVYFENGIVVSFQVEK